MLDSLVERDKLAVQGKLSEAEMDSLPIKAGQIFAKINKEIQISDKLLKK